MVGPEAQGLLQAGHRLDQPPLRSQGISQVAAGLEIVRLQTQRPLIAGDGLQQVTLSSKHVSQVVVRPGQIRLQTQGPIEVIDSQIVSARLTGDDPEKMQSINLVRIRSKDLKVKLLCLLQLASLNMLQG